MHPLYDIGYTEIIKVNVLAGVVKALDGIVLDIRLNPRSRLPQWNMRRLENELGSRYAHCESLGNENYKYGPIQIKNLEAGLPYVMRLLSARPVILMCVCRDREQCHRYTVIQAIEQRYGVTSIPLSMDICMAMIAAPAPHQLNLFGD
jgi:hypothetical protein